MQLRQHSAYSDAGKVVEVGVERVLIAVRCCQRELLLQNLNKLPQRPLLRGGHAHRRSLAGDISIEAMSVDGESSEGALPDMAGRIPYMEGQLPDMEIRMSQAPCSKPHPPTAFSEAPRCRCEQ